MIIILNMILLQWLRQKRKNRQTSLQIMVNMTQVSSASIFKLSHHVSIVFSLTRKVQADDCHKGSVNLNYCLLYQIQPSNEAKTGKKNDGKKRTARKNKNMFVLRKMWSANPSCYKPVTLVTMGQECAQTGLVLVTYYIFLSLQPICWGRCNDVKEAV